MRKIYKKKYRLLSISTSFRITDRSPLQIMMAEMFVQLCIYIYIYICGCLYVYVWISFSFSVSSLLFSTPFFSLSLSLCFLAFALIYFVHMWDVTHIVAWEYKTNINNNNNNEKTKSLCWDGYIDTFFCFRLCSFSV